MPRIRIRRPFADLRPGDELEVPADVAARWTEAGTAEPIERKARRSPPAIKAVLGPKETK